MVKNIQSLENLKVQKRFKIIFLVSLFLFAANCVFAQNQTADNSSFENNTSYFADSTDTGTTGSAEASTYKAPSTAGMIIKMLVVLALVVAALYGILRFFKNKNNKVQSDDDFMRRVSSLSFAPGKSVEVVTLVDRCFMLGVTDSNINLIAEITDKEMISAMNLNFDKKQATKKPMNFADVLDMFMPNGPRSRNNIYENSERAVDELSNNIQESEETNVNGENEQ